MKELTAKFIRVEPDGATIEAISRRLDELAICPVDELLWSRDNYKPVVNFSIAHSEEGILLKYRVREKYVKAGYKVTNAPVYKDSCVEFFFAPDNNANYYNFEFNCLGVALAGYGLADERELLPVELIQTIITLDTLTGPDNNNGLYHWELTLIIPFSIFKDHPITTMSGLTCRGNFYKCGDELLKPHYLSWNKVDSPVPNFHLPDYFGKIIFV